MVSNNFMEIHMGGGVFELGNPEGRGAQPVLEIQVERGVTKPCLPSWGCGFFLEKPINMLLIIVRTYIFSFYSLVMAASSDHPETMKATRSLDNSEVQSFS